MINFSTQEFDYIANSMNVHPSLEKAARMVLVDGKDRRYVRRRFRLGLAPMTRTIQRFTERRAALRCGK